MAHFYIPFFILLILCSFKIKGQALNNCDLIFITAGRGDYSKAITDATADKDSLQIVHAAIIWIDQNKEIQVIEADSENGVRIIRLADFLQCLDKDEKKSIALVKRLNMEFPVEQTICRALSHIGEPYDWSYLPSNGKMYCSELIYESFIDEEGNPIFKTQPMNFRNPDGTISQFWINLFEELGEEIPEGLPGTNPNDLSKDPRLKEVWRYNCQSYQY